MCEPVSLSAALLVIGVGSQVAGTIEENKAQADASKANKASANAAALAQLRGQNARSLEETTAADQAINEGGRDTASASALARLSALSAGVAGNSVDAVLGEIKGDQGRFNDSVKQNLDMTLLQIERGNMGIEAERVSRINSRPQPNPWVTGLSIGTSILNGVSQYRAGKPK